jgi:hypothetical protein
MEGMNMDLSIKIYDEKDNVLKEAKAKTVDLRYGTVRSIMELLNVDNINDTAELLRAINGAWGQLTGVLSKIFPEVEESDWDNVKIGELLPVVIAILKDSFIQVLKIPTDSKN